jgi:predicted membrane protein
MVVGIFMHVPWLLGIVVLFAFEFIEGNTVTRLYFMRLRRITQEALQTGAITPELEKA